MVTILVLIGLKRSSQKSHDNDWESLVLFFEKLSIRTDLLDSSS
jgi:hypothetical protein